MPTISIRGGFKRLRQMGGADLRQGLGEMGERAAWLDVM